jgi:hypothetical protein
MSEHAKVVDMQPFETPLGCRVTGYSILRKMGGTIIEQVQHITLEGPKEKVALRKIGPKRFKREIIR